MMNDKTKLVKKAKNDKASRCCWSAYQKRLGKMGLGEMLPNRSTIPPWLPKCNDYQQKLGGGKPAHCGRATCILPQSVSPYPWPGSVSRCLAEGNGDQHRPVGLMIWERFN